MRFHYARAAFLLVAAPNEFAHAFFSSTCSFKPKYSKLASTATETPSFIDETVSSSLQEYQNRAAPIATSFSPQKFNPAPWLSNKHVQTIAGAFLRGIPECNYVDSNNSVFPAAKAISTRLWDRLVSPENTYNTTFWDERERIDTPDGDWFHVDYKYSTKGKAKGTVIILHGLEANSKAVLSTDMGRAYQELGMDVACINFRGCSGVPNDTLGGYHLGFTNDLMHFLSILASRCEQSNLPPALYLSGYSLGGNVVLKALGELGEAAVAQYNIQGAAVLCTPMDCERNAPFLGAEGFNRQVYCKNLLNSLSKRGQQQLDAFCDGNVDTTVFDYHGVMSAKTITDFDEAFIAPIYGFDSAVDYYRKVSSVYFLEGIAVPTMILNAQDDPFMDPTHFPIENAFEGGGKAPLKMVQTEHGGHLGFTFHQTSRDNLDSSTKKPSWASVELARFIQHVHTHPLQTN